MKKIQILKLVVFVLLSITVYYQVLRHDNVGNIYNAFIEQCTQGYLLYLFIAILLMPINWFFEYLKWRVLIHRIILQSKLSSVKSVLAGITVSLLTPNRIGEYGGRMLFVGQKSVGRVIIASIVGSIAQWITIVGFGLLSLLYLNIGTTLFDFNPYVIAFLCLTLYLLLVLVYFNLYRLAKIGERKKTGWKKYLKAFRVLKRYSFYTLFNVLMFSLLRFLTYTTQYVLILMFFSSNSPLMETIMKVMSIFLAQLAIPVPPFLSVFSRAEVALLFLESSNINEMAVISSTFILWLVNLIIPSLIGLIIILVENKFKLFYRKK